MATLSASSLAPPPKKPRTESGDGDKDVLIEEEDEVISDDTNSLPDDVVDEYMRQVAESDGFEVDDFFEYSLFGAIRPCQMSDRLIKLVNPLTELAIKHFNKEKGANIQFVKLLKVTAGGGCGITFYITFEAMDAADSQIKTFQAKVLYGINDEVEFCRLKPQSIKQGFEVKSGVDGIPTGCRC